MKMEFKELIKPTKGKIIGLFVVSILLILLSYLFYNVFTVGVNDCASPCTSWLDPINPLELMRGCILMCVTKPIPNPLYRPLLQIGALLLVISLILFYKLKNKK